MLSRRASWKVGLIVTSLIAAAVVGDMLLSRPVPVSNSSSPPYFDYLVVVVLENMNLNQTYGSSCIGNCSYITQLADTYSIAINYSGVAHRSVPNYLTLTSGWNYAYSPFISTCAAIGANGCITNARNVVDAIGDTGRAWKVYVENYGGNCKAVLPFAYYTDFYYNSTRCLNIVDANPGAHKSLYSVPTALFSDLNSNAAPNFMWLKPDECDQGYYACYPSNSTTNPCGTRFPQCVSQVNEYLSLVVPRILGSTIFRTRNAALFITWDEGGGNVVSSGKICPGLGPTYPTCNDVLPAIIAGPNVKHGYRNEQSLSHYSFVKTLEVAWNLKVSWNLSSLPPIRILPMTDFFTTSLYASASMEPPLGGWILSDRICMCATLERRATT